MNRSRSCPLNRRVPWSACVPASFSAGTFVCLIGVLLGGMLGPPPAQAGPNAGGTLVVHDAGIAYTDDSASYPSPAPECAGVDNEIETEAWTVWKVYAAFNPYASPRLKALSWGITLTSGVRVLDAGLPDPSADFEIPQNGWPSTDGAGIGMSFGTTQTATVTECYWFGGYAQDLPQVFGTGAHPVQETMFVDDSVPGVGDPIAGHSTLGFGQAGFTDCPDVVPPGACCFADGTCLMFLEDPCLLEGGEYYGGACDPNPCPQPPPIGACCFADGSCAMLQEVACVAGGGTFYGGECVPNPCPQPPPYGACCFSDGSCVILQEIPCANAGGEFLGGGCSPNPCPNPQGACCFPDGSCQMLQEIPCAGAGGEFLGGDCDPNPCPQPPPPTGACCFPNGSCVVMTQPACGDSGGIFYGGDCVPNPCPAPPPTGACCFPSGLCVVMTQSACAASGGTFYGGPCSPNPCPQPPPPPPGGEGGETIGSATVIPAFPFAGSGSTCGHIDDYDYACPYTGSTSPDVVYSYAPSAHQVINIDLCASWYDTKVYVYENAVGTPIACNDDAGCGYSGWQSFLPNVFLSAGNIYFIVVDGYGGDCGDYVITFDQYAPCVVDCPAGALLEGEPPCVNNYYDEYNGGCNSAGWVPIEAQVDGTATLCGRSCTYLLNGLDYRDTDWYQVFAQGGSIGGVCTAEFALQFILIYGVDCDNLAYILDTAGPCEVSSLTWEAAPGAEIWFWVGPSVFSGVPESDYVLHIWGIYGGSTPTKVLSWGGLKARFRETPLRPEDPDPSPRVLSPSPTDPTGAADSDARRPWGPWSATAPSKPAKPVGAGAR